MIGAGAAGLVASRHLLGSGLRPLIFETSKAVGGEQLMCQVAQRCHRPSSCSKKYPWID